MSSKEIHESQSVYKCRHGTYLPVWLKHVLRGGRRTIGAWRFPAPCILLDVWSIKITWIFTSKHCCLHVVSLCIFFLTGLKAIHSTLFFLSFSRFLYPGKRWASADLLGDGGNSVESNCSGSKDGKYELLTAINDAIAEEIKDLMTKSKGRKIPGFVTQNCKTFSRSWRNFISFDHLNFSMFRVGEFVMTVGGLCTNPIWHLVRSGLVTGFVYRGNFCHLHCSWHDGPANRDSASRVSR